MTPKIPLNLKLKKKKEKDIAYAQDIMVEELYNFFPKAIIHGGTAIWRCYNGNRFSEDVDVYINRDVEKIEEFFSFLVRRGFKILKKRIKENSVYSELTFNSIPARFEATFQVKKAVFKKYETSESFFINVYTLSPEDLIIEKVNTYLKRKKIRDLYDIHFLLNCAETERIKVKAHILNLIKNFTEPVDEKNLKAIIIVGAIPNSKQLLEGIRRWVK